MLRIPRYLLFVIWITCLPNSVCISQPYLPAPQPGYSVKHFTDANGLPQNSVKSIVKDERGNIWLATERGVVRYDGINFKVFENFGKSNYYKSIGAFHLSPNADSRREFFAVNNEETFIKITDGQAIIDTSDYQKQIGHQPFGRLHDKDILITAGIPNFNERFEVAKKLVIPTGNDRYFLYDGTHVSYYERKKLQKSYPFAGRSLWEFFRLGNRLYHFHGKSLWQFPGNGSGTSPRKVQLSGPILQDARFAEQTTLSVFWNNCNDQAFVKVGQALYLLTAESDGILTTRMVCNAFDFEKGIITNIYWDPATNRLFLGSHFFGLYVISPKPFQVLTANFKGTDNVYYGQVPYGTDGLLANQGHLFSFDPTGRPAISTHLSNISQMVDWDKFGIQTDRQGRIWCKKAHSLMLLSKNAEKLVSMWELPREITILYQDESGRIWIGTRGQGLYRIDPHIKNPAIETVFETEVSNISWITHESADILWVATGSGLRRVDLRTGKVSIVQPLEGIYIRSLHIPKGSGQVWLTTYNDGFFLLEANKLTRFPLDKDGYLASSHCIFEDQKGYFWITTNRGLFQVKRSDLLAYSRKPFEIYYHYYDKEAGFNTNEFNGGCEPCAVRTSGGLVSFPSIDGLVLFRPENTTPELPVESINIETVVVNDEERPFSGQPIELSAEVARAVLKLNVAYLGNRKNLRMAFSLFRDGERTSEWREIDNATQTIDLPHLKSGNYILSIRKASGFGDQNFIYKNIRIVIQKDWYETWWFRGWVAILVAVFFYVALRWRTRRIQRRNLALEASVSERTRDLETVLQALGHSEKQLEHQLRLHIHMIACISHDIRTPMKYVGTALKYLAEPIRSNQPEVALSGINTILQTMGQLDQMIDNVVTFIRPEVNKSVTDIESVALSDLLAERCKIFDDLNDMNGSTINIRVDPQLIVPSNRDLLGIIVHNLIDNGLKARRGNTIEIYSEKTVSDRTALVFYDHGPGLPPHLIEWLMEDSVDGVQSPPEGFNGLGLSMIKELCKLLAITIFVENNPGGKFQLVFPPV